MQIMNLKEILGSLKERMRGPLYVPTVSTISLVVAMAGLVLALIGCIRRNLQWTLSASAMGDGRSSPRSLSSGGLVK